MTRVIVIKEAGGPEVLELAHAQLSPPQPGEVRIRQTAIGVNYHDVYVRSGLYSTLTLPGVPGIEAVGVIEELGEGVTGFTAGDRVGYVTNGYVGYVEARNIDARLLIRLPDTLSDVQAAATLMKGFTACVLVNLVHQVRERQNVLVHAAAGGAGRLITSWASALGARVIATVGSEAKADIARAHGASEVIYYREENVPGRISELTRGRGVAVAYDSVGADTFMGSMESLGYEGKLVLFGQSSGPVEPFAPALLADRSLSVARPIVFHYIRTVKRQAAIAEETFAALAQGVIRPIDPLVLPLEEAAEAHRLLEARQSPGGIVLVP